MGATDDPLNLVVEIKDIGARTLKEEEVHDGHLMTGRDHLGSYGRWSLRVHRNPYLVRGPGF